MRTDICVNSDSTESLAELEQQTNRDVLDSTMERLRNPESLASPQIPFSSEHDVPLMRNLLPLMAFRDGQSLDYRLPHRGSANGQLLSELDQGCPDLSLASSLSSSSILGEILSPELPFPRVPSCANLAFNKGSPYDENERRTSGWMD